MQREKNLHKSLLKPSSYITHIQPISEPLLRGPRLYPVIWVVNLRYTKVNLVKLWQQIHRRKRPQDPVAKAQRHFEAMRDS